MNFSAWKHWQDRNQLDNLKYPGIYILLYGKNNISGRNFYWAKNIIYVGMTNSKGGLKGRLQQFENTIAGKTRRHGGAERVIYKHKQYSKFISDLYVSVRPFICDTTSNGVKDLFIMGKVAEFEYICFAEYVKRFKHLPEFNDKKESPKKK
jgi:hypothetical protein